MKLFTIIFLQALLVFQVVSAQQVPVETAKKIDLQSSFLKKRAVNNNVGWAFVTGGVLIGMAGALTTLSGAVKTGSNSNQKVNGGTTTFIIGNTIALASIPFFIAAHKYKQKAQLGYSFHFNERTFNNSPYPTVALSVNF